MQGAGCCTAQHSMTLKVLVQDSSQGVLEVESCRETLGTIVAPEGWGQGLGLKSGPLVAQAFFFALDMASCWLDSQAQGPRLDPRASHGSCRGQQTGEL